MPIIQLNRTKRPILGDDRDWKREKDAQILELQQAVERHDQRLFQQTQTSR